MNKKRYFLHKFAKQHIKGLAFDVLNGTHDKYEQLPFLGEFAETLDDDNFELLFKDVLRLIEIGAIENQSIKKEYNRTVALRKEAVDAFKNLDITQWLPKK